jgi:hypothetical protein
MFFHFSAAQPRGLPKNPDASEISATPSCGRICSLRHKPSDDGIILNGSIETLLRQMLKQSKPTIVETSDLLKGIQTHLVSLFPAGMHIYTIL